MWGRTYHVIPAACGKKIGSGRPRKRRSGVRRRAYELFFYRFCAQRSVSSNSLRRTAVGQLGASHDTGMLSRMREWTCGREVWWILVHLEHQRSRLLDEGAHNATGITFVMNKGDHWQ